MRTALKHISLYKYGNLFFEFSGKHMYRTVSVLFILVVFIRVYLVSCIRIFYLLVVLESSDTSFSIDF